MNSVDFCFWLQGHFELSGTNTLDEEATKKVKDHLDLVFVHEIDPMREKETTATKEELHAAHSGSGNDVKMRC